jgi:hypothetical protein
MHYISSYTTRQRKEDEGKYIDHGDSENGKAA